LDLDLFFQIYQKDARIIRGWERKQALEVQQWCGERWLKEWFALPP
jgi:hypothetical protein